MESYFSISPLTGKPTGIRGYEFGADDITIYFTSGSIYNYSIASCGDGHIQTMKSLAIAQEGLNTYVTKHKPDFAWKR
jgi:hypothetical protein